MAYISDVTATWSSPVTLTANEIWQCSRGSVRVTSEASPAELDGLILTAGHGVQFGNGQVIRYKLSGLTFSTITRTVVA